MALAARHAAAEVGVGAASPSQDATFAALRWVDPQGLSLLRSSRRHTPTGFLLPYPFEPPPERALGDGWTARGFLEAGATFSTGGSDEASFDDYLDRSDGPTGAFRIETRRRSDGGHLELGGHAVGRDDPSFFLEAGRRNLLRLRARFDEIPHRLAHDARILFRGAGSERLTLPAPLLPGANSDAEIDAALAETGESRLAITRERAAFDLRFAPVERLELSAGYRMDSRRGERPFGGAIFFGFLDPEFGSVVETVEPIDSRTHDFRAGLAIRDPRFQAELEYSGSVFESDVDSLTWENPFPDTGVDRGRFALAPDNLLHRLHGLFSFALPWGGRWTHTLAWSTAQQDERLLAPTVNPSFADWVDPDTSLSRRSADARVDTTFITSTLQLKPLSRLRLGARLRYRRRDSRTNYEAFNPSTGEYGYVVEDGSFDVQPRFAAVPFDRESLHLAGDATWRIAPRTRMSLELEREQNWRDQRARGQTREHRGRLALSARGLPRTTVRLTYELSSRDGSSFRRGRDAIFYSVGPPGFDAPDLGTPQRSLTSFEQPDLSDRLRHDGSLRVHFAVLESADLSLTGAVVDEDYDARHGVQAVRRFDLGLELNLRPSPVLEARIFAHADWGRRELDSIDSALETGDDLEPGGPVFPNDHAWSLETRSRNVAAGAGVSWRPHASLELSGDYQLLSARERLSYDFAGPGALAEGVTAAEAGSALPDLRHTDQVLVLQLRWAILDWLSTHFGYRLQHATIDDFQQKGLVPRIGRTLYLAHVDGDFLAQTFWAGARLRF